MQLAQRCRLPQWSKMGVVMGMMDKIRSSVFRFIRDTSGATLIEYGIALLVVVVVGSATLGALATAVGNEITDAAEAF